MLVATWGELFGVVARLIHARPGIAFRLALAPGRAIHATAAYLHHAVASGYVDEAVRPAAGRLQRSPTMRRSRR